ncbi:hypothetical protein CL645_04200 [bacterium]|nr:hypothetical protein [bacterium]
MNVLNRDYEDPIKKIQQKIDKVPSKITELQEEIFRLKTENSKHKETAKAFAFISLWTENLLNGTLENKETLSELASFLKLKHLVLWQEEEELMNPVFQFSATKKINLEPLRIGKEIAGSTNVIGKIRIFDLEDCSIAVKENMWAEGKTLISIPIKTQTGSYVLEACDFFDGMPLKKQTFEILEVLAPWTVLGN